MVEKYLIEWCSSTLASLKTASLFNWHYVHDNITLEQVKSSIDEMNEKFKEKGIQIEILREEETWALIYVYRVKKLEEDLKKNEVSKFLRENGYKETCVNYAISLLKKRLMDLLIIKDATLNVAGIGKFTGIKRKQSKNLQGMISAE